MRPTLALTCVALPALLLAACAQKPAQPDTAAPAASDGKPALALRAVGTEPGWSVEIGDGERPRMSLQLDYGQRTLEVPSATRIEENNAYAGDASDGTPVSLSYKREQCSDGMSDRDYLASVSLQVGSQQYHGCAEFPSP